MWAGRRKIFKAGLSGAFSFQIVKIRSKWEEVLFFYEFAGGRPLKSPLRVLRVSGRTDLFSSGQNFFFASYGNQVSIRGFL